MFEELIYSKQEKQDLKDLINLTVLQDEELGKYVKIVTGITNGDPLSYIGDMDDVGKEGAGCNPVYEEVGIVNRQKRWELGDWQIPIKMCYEAMKGTLMEAHLNPGTDIQDLTTTEIMTKIIRPALERQVRRMIWRFGWFGNKSAQNVADGGVITDGLNVDKFTVTDGLWKKIFDQVATNADQLTTIAANTQATYAGAKAAMLGTGVATGILDSVLMDADARISENGGILMLTKNLADAVHHDMKQKFNTIMEWKTLFDGFDVAVYDGVPVARVGIWDQMIRAYEKNGDKLNLPYRAVYANPENFLIGTNASTLVSDLDIFFDHKERMNYIYSAGKIGTNILEDELFHVAY